MVLPGLLAYKEPQDLMVLQGLLVHKVRPALTVLLVHRVQLALMALLGLQDPLVRKE